MAWPNATLTSGAGGRKGRSGTVPKPSMRVTLRRMHRAYVGPFGGMQAIAAQLVLAGVYGIAGAVRRMGGRAE